MTYKNAGAQRGRGCRHQSHTADRSRPGLCEGRKIVRDALEEETRSEMARLYWALV